MEKKHHGKSVVRRFLYWQYSGLITVPLVIGVILIAWFGYMGTLEFYDGFSCDGLVTYKVNQIGIDTNPSYDEMTPESQLHYDEILEQCKVGDYWYHDGFPVGVKELAILENKEFSILP